jgi:adenosylhomocysteine nucleosidase
MTEQAPTRRLGIMTAMNEEFSYLSRHITNASTRDIGPRTFHEGRIHDTEVVLVCARIGKVAAATTATALIQGYDVDEILFTGVAGGIAPHVGVGDIVIGKDLVQHDFDIKGLLGCSRFTIPLLNVSHIPACERLLDTANRAAEWTRNDAEYKRAIASLVAREPVVHCGTIASGDIFVSSPEEKAELLAHLPDLLCVEMEGAAVAQVCAEHKVPYVVARVISDAANGNAHVDFTTFIESVAAVASEKIVLQFIQQQKR